MPAGQQAKPEAHDTALGHGQHPQPFTENPFGLHDCVGMHALAFHPEKELLTGQGVQSPAAAETRAAAAKTATQEARGMAATVADGKKAGAQYQDKPGCCVKANVF